MNSETRIPRYSIYGCSALNMNMQRSHQDDIQVVLMILLLHKLLHRFRNIDGTDGTEEIQTQGISILHRT